MAIAVDATAHDLQLSVSDISYAHVFSGSDRLVWIGALTFNVAATVNITSVTVNGVAATPVGLGNFTTTGGVFCQYGLFYLVAPDLGSQTIHIVGDAVATAIVGDSASYTGAAQTGVPDASASENQVGAVDFSKSFTPFADNCWVVAAVVNAEVNQSVGGGSSPSIVARIPASGTSGAGLFDTDGPAPPPGPGATIFDINGDATPRNWRGIVASFAPVVISGAPLLWMGTTYVSGAGLDVMMPSGSDH